MSGRRPWGEDTEGPHVWKTLGYRSLAWGDGLAAIEWTAAEEHSFGHNGTHVVHGGLVATLLDTAMGGACASVLDDDSQFLTADLRVEFFRPARPGPLRADGHVVHRSRRAVFCAAELYDPDDRLLASARCTQIVLPA